MWKVCLQTFRNNRICKKLAYFLGNLQTSRANNSEILWIQHAKFSGHCFYMNISIYRNSHPEVVLRRGVLKICTKFTGEHPCRSVTSLKLQSSFIEIAFWHGCFPVNLLHIFRTTFPRNTSGWMLLHIGRYPKSALVYL